MKTKKMACLIFLGLLSGISMARKKKCNCYNVPLPKVYISDTIGNLRNNYFDTAKTQKSSDALLHSENYQISKAISFLKDSIIDFGYSGLRLYIGCKKDTNTSLDKLNKNSLVYIYVPTKKSGSIDQDVEKYWIWKKKGNKKGFIAITKDSARYLFNNYKYGKLRESLGQITYQGNTLDSGDTKYMFYDIILIKSLHNEIAVCQEGRLKTLRVSFSSILNNGIDTQLSKSIKHNFEIRSRLITQFAMRKKFIVFFGKAYNLEDNRDEFINRDSATKKQLAIKSVVDNGKGFDTGDPCPPNGEGSSLDTNL